MMDTREKDRELLKTVSDLLEIKPSSSESKPFDIEDIKDMIKKIDLNYFEFKKNKASRYSVEWGVWSREMNLKIHEVLKNETTNKQIKARLVYVFFMWVSASRLLELNCKHRLTKSVQKRKTMDEISDFRRLALSEVAFSDPDKEIKTFYSFLGGGVQK